MSGGVDSSVVAGLLSRQGHEVIGVTLQLYDHGEATARRGGCCAGQDIHDARRVADRLGIPHYVLDYEERFKSAVMRPFAESYVAGETPIPCVACNQRIKFHDLLATARELGADLLATGHYIEQREGPNGPRLYRARDAERDQSYFLFATTQAQLAALTFPLGGLAQERGAGAGARLRASRGRQVGQPGHLLRARRGATPASWSACGPAPPRPATSSMWTDACSGRHGGIIHYTIGQRRGLGIPDAAPLYVVRLDTGKRQVVVGPRESLHTRWIGLRDVNWLGDAPLAQEGTEVAVRIRSSAPLQPATVYPDGSKARVLLAGAEYGVAAGQACVFYAGAGPRARILGGGWIEGATLSEAPARKVGRSAGFAGASAPAAG